MLLLLLYVLPIKEPKPSKAYTGIRISVSAITAMLLVYICFSCYNNMKWAEMSKRSLRGETEKMLPHYEQMMPVLGHNPYFLYNYSAELNYIGLYEESNTIAELCIKRMNDYDVQLLLADNYTNMHQYDRAIESYRTASVMVPSRFVPLEEIMDIYILQYDTAGAVQIAEEIMNKPVKVESATVDAIRRKAEELINKYQR
jgi:tetratricopeptide (TPR) repeat protein